MDVQRLSFRRIAGNYDSNNNGNSDSDYSCNNAANIKAGHQLTHVFLHIDGQGVDPYDVQGTPDSTTIFSSLSVPLPTTINNNVLRRIHCDAPINLKSEALPLIIRRCHQLEDIKLSTISLTYLQLMLSELHYLQKLHLAGCQNIKEQDWIVFFVYWNDYNTTGLDHVTMKTFHRKLIQHTTCLCHLYIVDCGDVFGTNEKELREIVSKKEINLCTTKSLPL
ncbi:hypothetical protein BDC45DRAFT_530918 [Circinella umbellata]|nr:hypothetical protein BDC45DRAFT_530918 [Circinella umbellata]